MWTCCVSTNILFCFKIQENKKDRWNPKETLHVDSKRVAYET